MFSTSEIAETVDLVGSLTDEQVVLLVRLYCLTREIVEQDARLLVVDSSETLVRLRRQIRRAYWELVAISPGCRTLCELVYTSVPGWCLRCRYTVPNWYYHDGCYVGPCRSARYAGAFSVRAYRAHFDSGTRSDWRGGRARFDGKIVRNPKRAQGIHHRYTTAAKTHAHAKTKHGMARASKHGPASKAKHGGPAAAAKHRGPHKGRNVAAHPAKHGGPLTKARHGRPRSKSSPQSQPHRQQPKRGVQAPKGKAAAHPQHAPHGQARHKAGHARHK
jgi:hypothetical protein